ncbi:MAG: tRNA (adenosine(37)-N6)-threonylcarbamoyltransferase complex ATPase subunit type 1 TsaE [Mariprofundaceae bacterium]|nr:tRNA (adenosine(37)-N6)-threonylcarbamoyltransferase complex ATPase subunit type 1 TsaE [Mariprofundaceae bacterium]
MHHNFEYLFNNEQDTMAWAKCLAGFLKPGDVLALSGELGVGKSVVSRTMMRTLHVQDAVLPSPTYAIIQEYDGVVTTGGLCRIAHMDWYRLEGEDDADMLGIREFFEPPWICFIEWPEQAQGLLPHAVLKLHLSYVHGDVKKRRLCLSGVTAKDYVVSIADSWRVTG